MEKSNKNERLWHIDTKLCKCIDHYFVICFNKQYQVGCFQSTLICIIGALITDIKMALSIDLVFDLHVDNNNLHIFMSYLSNDDYIT